jgi:hypothetical protein
VGGVSLPGAHEIVFEVISPALPTDVFYSHTEQGKKFLSATTNTSFYYIPQNNLEEYTNISPTTSGKATAPVEERMEIQDHSHPIEEIDNQNIPERRHSEYIYQPPVNSEIQDSNAPSISTSGDSQSEKIETKEMRIDQSETMVMVSDQFRSLKKMLLRSDGGCQETIGLNTLRVQITLADRFDSIYEC